MRDERKKAKKMAHTIIFSVYPTSLYRLAKNIVNGLIFITTRGCLQPLDGINLRK